MAKEANLQDKILRDLDSLGKYCVAFKIRKSSVDGTPDIFFTTLKTGAVFIEVKNEDTGKVSADQTNMLRYLNECGCKAFQCWTWKEWIDIKKLLFLI